MLTSKQVVDWFGPWIGEFIWGFPWPMPEGAVVTSWYRPRRFWGDPSQHRVALGIDVDGPDLDAIEAWARRSPWIVVREWDHVHVQYLPAGTLEALGLEFSTIP